MARLKIAGDGTRAGTRVEVDGELLQGVQSAVVTIGVDGNPQALILVKRPELDIDGEFRVAVDEQ